MNIQQAYNAVLVNDGYSLVPYREQDMFRIMQWRNEQIGVLRQNVLLTKEEQESYYKNRIAPTFTQAKPAQMLFSYLKEGSCIGYGGLTNIKWNDGEAEISFLVTTNRSRDPIIYRHDMTIFLTLMKKLAFDLLPLKYLFTETYPFRTTHMKILEDNGLRLEKKINNGSSIHSISKEEYEPQE